LNQRNGNGRDAPLRGERWRFGDCLFDGYSLELQREGRTVPLEPKPLELLMLLLRHAGEVMTKDELLEALWPGRVLSESVLTKCVARLRAALGDESQSLVRTVHGFGYRLAATVTVEAGAVVPSPPQARLAAGKSPPLRPLWKLVEPLGTGGSADVWLAEHTKTGDRRVFKFARDAAALAGLKREITLYRVLRNTLGPRADLVALLDWNLEEAPCFLESEFAAGGSLLRWAESRGGLGSIPLADRLAVAADVASTLSAAHGAGVLHKDLKPANVLVAPQADGGVQLKLADFGSGGVLDAGRLEALQITRLGFTIPVGTGTGGTPLYLAPELLAGQLPTARSDVYALGVMLYQLVVGDFRRPLAPGWEQDVDDDLLREDIAAAAAGNPAQRLGDAGALAQRLRSLAERRVERLAERRRDELAAQLQRQVERARARRGLQRALVVVLVAGLCVSALGFREARRSQRQAEAMVAFLTDDLLATTDPFGGGRPMLTIQDLLNEAAPRLQTRLAAYPVARAEMGLALARAYEGLGAWSAARERLETALREAGGDRGAESDLALRIEERLAYLSMLQARYGESEQRYGHLYAAQLARHGALHEQTLAARDGLAWLQYERGHFEDAARAYEALIGDYRKAGIADASSAQWSLADCYLELNRFGEAEQLMASVLAEAERAEGWDHPRTLWMRYTLGDLLMMQGRFDAAAAVFEGMYNGLSKSLGERHPYTLTALHYRGTLLLERGEPAAALPLLRRAYEGRAAVHGEQHPWTGYSAGRVGEALVRLGRADEALPLLTDLARRTEDTQGESHPNLLSVQIQLAEALIASKRLDEAESVVRRARATSAAPLPPGNLRLGQLALTEGRLRLAQHRLQPARVAFDSARRVFEPALGPQHPLVAEVLGLAAAR
jgi:non-specific serine/threonine protein kinase